MKKRSIFLSLLCFFVFSLLGRTTLATKRNYVVYLGSHDHGPDPNSSHFDKAKEDHIEFLASFLGSKEKAEKALIYSYTKSINGFAASLEEEQSKEIAKHPDVMSIFLSKTRKLHTTHSWSFLGLESATEGQLFKAPDFGSDIIIGALDTGVYSGSESFNDEGLGPIPSRWKGSCEPNDVVTCNRKLIGAKYFDYGYKDMMINEFETEAPPSTAHDTMGHGTHTLSTIAGRRVRGVNLFGFGNGTARGALLNARVASYKVCWPPINENATECCDIDILAGFDAAIHDGVDVISVSLAQAMGDGESQPDYWMDTTAIGAFHAMKKGIIVVCSAGNDGPTQGTVANVAPWILTVGASMTDRGFINYVTLGNGKKFMGQSLSTQVLLENKFYPLVHAARVGLPDVDSYVAVSCQVGSLDPEKVRGKIVACLDGDLPRVVKGKAVADAGGVGMIIVNFAPSDVYADLHYLPASHISENASTIFEYIKTDPNPTATISSSTTQLGLREAPSLACYSSRGPSSVNMEILKPDIIAPGMSILAAYSKDGPLTELASDNRRVLYHMLSGTSMASPHVAAMVAILKLAHPDWSPSAIKSALMTSTRTRNDLKQTIRECTTQTEANPLGFGAGHVRLYRAMDPGLIYDLTMHDYLNLLCTMGYNDTQFKNFIKKSYECPKDFDILNFNYPAITIPALRGSVTVRRILKNVGPPATYNVTIVQPYGITVTVQPKQLKFEKLGEKKMYWLTVTAQENIKTKTFVFGMIRWWNGGVHSVKSPISVMLAQEEEAEE